MTLTWLITGTSSGFGRILTEQLIERGDRVAATLRSPGRLDDLVARAGDRLWVRALDVTDRARVQVVVDDAFAELGRVDVVVSNAGYTLVGAAEEATDEQIVRQFDTNVLGPIRLVRAALPHLRAQGGGRILQIGSNVGHIGVPGAAYYSASKFAVVGFFEALRAEVEPFGIGVTIVEPGGATTSFVDGADMAPVLEAYSGTPAAAPRGLAQHYDPPGDARKMVAAMIASVDTPAAPRRLVLGSDSYSVITGALRDRLAQVEAQSSSASLTDR
jgi:NAD(P)-dependent dehydrogenase (short-subunit alcohol dehydrogenase family)